MFIRDESFQTFIRRYPIITFLTAIHIIVFLLINFTPFRTALYHLMVGSNYYIVAGEYWRLFTPIITHEAVGHLVFNSFSLLLFGPALEQLLGKVRFVIGYVGAGLIANIATLLMLPLSYAHIGASGSIFGLFGIYVYMLYSRKHYMDRANTQILLIVLAISLVSTFLNERINVLGHLFGLIGGAALAPIILASLNRRKNKW
ncbi:rhomboid family intramembrane serine protease [Fictibacillus phosphorivorans]|uniref:rhomboid family intramembrane serine protease n=1 Tax=Fictibacillus phosphorivorans TaxID=1221500 RepID=UPI00203C64D2|nr:rhomboid family intramembrane serine protease [Fictibacillus phosphorivorans]MCM3719391.1 rhomboid family intramembrane serine protease [Fictibacillus phosphorivorans]MCM3777131.1 rhomboid family intramembrane serine protease [Fictibacillus phosphorivorans]